MINLRQGMVMTSTVDTNGTCHSVNCEALRKNITDTCQGQTPEERPTDQNQTCDATCILLLLFSNKIILTHSNLSLLEQGTMSTISKKL